jgi:hypothetical protein
MKTITNLRKEANEMRTSYTPLAVLLANDIYCPLCRRLSNSADNAESILKRGFCTKCREELSIDHVEADVLNQHKQEALEMETINFGVEEKFNYLY